MSGAKNPARGLFEEFRAAMAEDSDADQTTLYEAFLAGVGSGLANAKLLYTESSGNTAPIAWIDVMGKLITACMVAVDAGEGGEDDIALAQRLLAYHDKRMAELKKERADAPDQSD